jgi:hypothetical protein
MADNCIATLGWQTLSQLTPAISPAAAGLFLSPLSLYIALVLVLNGAGGLMVLRHGHAVCC